MEHRAKIIGAALFCVAVGSEALTLGRVRGAALIGQPLDLVIQVQIDAGEDASSLCFDADVFHADTRQDASRVRVAVEATAQSQQANVRVLSSAAVDEPVVTVYLRTGCGQKTTRRYVLLADYPSEVAASSMPLTPSVPSVAPVSARSPALLDTNAATPVSAVKAETVQIPKQTVRRRVDSKRPEVKPAAAPLKSVKSDDKSPARRPTVQPRLKLDTLELLSSRVATLESSTPATPPEDTLRDMQKMQALEGDVKALLALAAKNEASLADLKVRLQKAESERFPGGVVYGLIALVLASLAAVVVLWRRQRRVRTGGDDWWSGSIATPESASVLPEPVPEPAAASKALLEAALASDKARPPAMATGLKDAGPPSELDVSMIEMSESNFDQLMASGAPHNAIRKPSLLPSPVAASQTSTSPASSPNFNAVFDTRQQAEFFVSLGKTDQALRLLEKQISDSNEPNPLIYLDLLGLCHSLSLKTDFRQFREDFNQLFNANIPEFALFRDEGKGLEAYPEVLSHITAHWATPKVLTVIEACIFRDPWGAKSQPFDLAAFRDLLLLHAVARTVVLAPQRADGKPGVASSSSASASFADSGYAAPAAVDLPLEETPFPGMLDLDFSAWEMEGGASHPAPASDVDLPPVDAH